MAKKKTTTTKKPLAKKLGAPQNVDERVQGVCADLRTIFENGIADLRKEIGGQAGCVSMLKHHQFLQMRGGAPISTEVEANIDLAYRHLEDARMRLGKVFEALGSPSPFAR